LTEALRDGSANREAALGTLPGLIDGIDVAPLPARDQVALTAHGLIAQPLGLASQRMDLESLVKRRAAFGWRLI
jgi:hypothetical protein